MISVEHLTKRYKDRLAVDDVSFTVERGRVTGFLGPNGAGKSTTMRAILGLDAPTAGTALIDGTPYRQLNRPLTTVGSLLDAGAAHRGRTARNHLRWMAQSNGIAASRVDDVLETVGLASEARTQVGEFSLGMSQRLGIAAALLGEPDALVLDEPMNGLDPEGIAWIRRFLAEQASADRAVLVSSHLMSEMAQVVDVLVVLAGGKVRARGPLAQIVSGHDSLEAAYFALTSGDTRYRSEG